MELDSPSTCTTTRDDFTFAATQDLRTRAEEAVKKAKEAVSKRNIFQKEAKTDPEAAIRYQAARKDANQLWDEANILKMEAGLPVGRRRKTKRSKTKRSNGKKSDTYIPRKSSNSGREPSNSGKMSSTSGIKKKTKEPKPKPLSKPPLRAHIESRTGTGVWVWSVAEGKRELRGDEVQMMQGMQDLKLLLPPPQMLEAEGESKPKRKQRPTKAERKEMALLAAAEELVAKVHVEVEGARELIVHVESEREQRKQRAEIDRQKRKQRLEERNIRLGMELDLELKALEDKSPGEFQERLDRKGVIKDNASRERRRKVVAQALAEREEAEVDDVAAKLGLLGMGGNHGQ
jgi:hypothetical protein